MLDVTKREGKAPFDTARLDRLMDEAGIDVLVVTSKHNVQYLLGGHRAFFFESMDAMGLSRYLPVFVYAKGAPDKAGFFGHRMENFQNEVKPFWVSEINVKSSGSVDVMEKAVDYVRKLGPKPKRHRRRARVPARRFSGRSAQSVSRQRDQGRAVRARAACARCKTPEELEKLRDRLRSRDRFHGGGVSQLRRRRHQGRTDRSAAPRGDIARADLRLLPDRGGIESQPRAVGPALGEGRRAVARFRRQLSRLYRRRCAHGRSSASRTTSW